MIKLVPTPSKMCPVVVCDHCQERIEDARQGNVYWRQWKTHRFTPDAATGTTSMEELPPRESILVDDGQFYTLHKKCTRVFETIHADEQQGWVWMGLTELFSHLIDNTKVTYEDLDKSKEFAKAFQQW